MIRRILSGLVSGVVLGAVVLVVASQFLPMTVLAPPVPEAGEAVVPAGSEFNAERPDDAPVLPQTEGRPEGLSAPEVSQPGTATAPMPDTSPAATPETGAPSEELSAPQAASAPVVAVETEEAVAASPGTPQPAQPGVDATPEPTEPLNVPETGAQAEAGLQAPGIGTAPQVEPEAEASVDVAAVAAPPAQPAVDAAPEPDAPAAPPEAAESPAEIASPAPQPDLPAVQVPAAPPEAAESPAEIASPAPQPDLPRVLVPDAPIGFGGQAPEIGDLSPGIDTDRLPRIGAEEPAPEAEMAQAEPALSRFAVPFEAAAGMPLLALVLLDGAEAPDPASLADFPVPLTVAIDPNSEGAGLRMAAYRDAGLEVAVLTPLPEGATPADVEVSFQGFLAAVPEAVAVMDMPAALMQESRPRASQVVEILAETGHGMLTYDRGLNSGLQIAEVRGVAAASVFRVFDDGSRDGGAIKRYLDQGAFRAGQVGPVVMVGQLRADSIAAIAEWALGTRAATVGLAPLSAVLQAR